MTPDPPEDTKLAPAQRMAISKLRRKTGRAAGEPLQPEDWEIAWKLHEGGANQAFHRLLFALPSSPRCGVCGAPFEGIGKLIGDEVMALYLPEMKKKTMNRDQVPATMLEHAHGLLQAVGYGTGDGPFVEMGIGHAYRVSVAP